MTSILNSLGLIFVHIPKNAGTSVANMLSLNSNIIDVEIGGTKQGENSQLYFIKKYKISKHSTAQQIKNAVGSKHWDKYIKFAIYRDPLERFHSIFNFLKVWDWHGGDLQKSIIDCTDINNFISDKIYLNPTIPDLMFRPQHKWIVDTNNKLLTNYLINYEFLNTELPNFLTNLNLDISNLELGKYNVTDNKKHYVLNKKSIDQLTEYYEDDYNLFKILSK
jgi:hypothetical protein